jgi:hypothetical protein
MRDLERPSTRSRGVLPAATVVPPARFAQLPPGWHVSTDAPIVLLARGTHGTTLATNWLANLSAPYGWSAQLRPGRVAITVMLIREPSACSNALPPLRLPLDLAQAQHATLEGSSLAEDRLAGRGHGYDVDLRVDYGTAHPSGSIRQRVQRVLTRLQLPVWPGRC